MPNSSPCLRLFPASRTFARRCSAPKPCWRSRGGTPSCSWTRCIASTRGSRMLPLVEAMHLVDEQDGVPPRLRQHGFGALHRLCLLYTSDAADDLTRVDLGGRRIIKK